MIINIPTALVLLFCSGCILNFACSNTKIDNIVATNLSIIGCLIGGVAGISLVLAFII